MKIIISAVVFLIMLMPLTLFAQRGDNLVLNPITCDEYLQNPELDKFIGIWTGINNGKSITLELKKVKIHVPTLIPSFSENKCYDAIFGFHKFIVNGSEIESTLNLSNSTVYEKKWTVLGGTEESNINRISGTLEHISKNKSIKFRITYIDPTHIKIESLENLPGVRINEPGKPPYDSSIDIPSCIILTKQ